MVKINQKFITKRKNTRPGWKQVGIRGIVVHYTANPGAGAENHYRYFNNGAGGRSASAHYFVDAKEIIQIIPDNEVAFHVNEGKTRKLSWMNASISGYVGNGNVCSIGIEMCQEKDGSFHPNTVKQTQELIAMLMKKYNIGISRVVRHYDQTGKFCPGPYVSSATAWNNFKAGIGKQQENKGGLSVSEYKELKALIEAQDKEIKALKKAQEGNTSQEASKVLEKEWNWGVSKEITDGRNPHQPASRQHVIAFLARYNDLLTINPTAKKDLQELFDTMYEEGHFSVKHTLEGKSDSEVLSLLISSVNRVTRKEK